MPTAGVRHQDVPHPNPQPGLFTAFQSGPDITSARTGLDRFVVDAFAGEDSGKKIDRDAFIAGRIRRIDAYIFLQQRNRVIAQLFVFAKRDGRGE